MVLTRNRPRHGAASWWLLLVLLLFFAAGAYLWHQQRRPPERPVRSVRVATADSSGVLASPDTVRPGRAGEPTARGDDSAPPGPFVAPPPDFQDSRSVPVASFLAYAAQMQFDPTRGVDLVLPSDEFGRERTIQVEPLRNIRLLDSTAIGEGRVLARIRSEATVNNLSLHNGLNYLWVRGQLGGPLLAEVWSNQPLVPPKILPLDYSPRPPEGAPLGKDVFWVGGDITSKVLWIACGRGWCHSEAGG